MSPASWRRGGDIPACTSSSLLLTIAAVLISRSHCRVVRGLVYVCRQCAEGIRNVAQWKRFKPKVGRLNPPICPLESLLTLSLV